MLLSLANVSVRSQGHTLLTDISFSIEEGQFLTLIGPNGGGKTTLLKVILGLMKPSKGRIHKKEGLTFGYMPQHIYPSPLMPMTVERFLSLCVSDPINGAEVLERAGAKNLLNRQIKDLSGGEWQRVLLARCLIRSPKLLILDEPMQGVDILMQAEMYRCLLKIREESGCAILMVSHDLQVVFSKSDLVLCLNKHICCSGAPEDVSASEAYLGLYHHHHDHKHD